MHNLHWLRVAILPDMDSKHFELVGVIIQILDG